MLQSDWFCHRKLCAVARGRLRKGDAFAFSDILTAVLEILHNSFAKTKSTVMPGFYKYKIVQ